MSSSFFLDPETKENLEWETFLGSVQTYSPLGRIQKERLQPFFPSQKAELRKEINRTAAMAIYLAEQPAWGAELEALLGDAKDVKRSLDRAERGWVLTVAELFEIKRFILISSQIRELLGGPALHFLSPLRPHGSNALFQILCKGGQSPQSFSLSSAYSRRLAAVRDRRNRLQQNLEQEKRAVESFLQLSGVQLDSQNTVTLTRDSAAAKRVSDSKLFMLVEETVQRVTFRLQRTPQGLVWLEEDHRLKGEEEQEEKEVLISLSREIGKRADGLCSDLNRLAALDFLLTKAQLANRYKGTKPDFLPEGSKVVLRFKEGVHWPLAQRLQERGLSFQPLSIELARGAALVTGANMSGKTVLLKTIGLLVAMAQHGFLVPAQQFSWVPRDFLFFSTRRREQDGLSAYGAEIVGIQRMLRERARLGLLLIDELARGTNPSEGFAINAALLRYLHGMASAALFTTHFEGLASATDTIHWQMAGMGEIHIEEVRSLLRERGEMILPRLMCYKLEKVTSGKPIPRDALKIALLLGLEEEVIKLAERYNESFVLRPLSPSTHKKTQKDGFEKEKLSTETVGSVLPEPSSPISTQHHPEKEKEEQE